MTSPHPLAAKAYEVIRLVGQIPDEFVITTEVPKTADAPVLGVVVTRKDTGARRVYEINGNNDWTFELETDIKGGYFRAT